MKIKQGVSKNVQSPIFHYPYLMTLFLLTLTGFGQMPIFKRYYIADIPGFGWLAQFYVTHYIHYLAAILFLALFTYVIVDYLATNPKRKKITTAGYVRGAILTGLVISGVFLVVRNLKGSVFSPGFIIFLDLFHMGLVITFLTASLYCVITKQKWAKDLNLDQ